FDQAVANTGRLIDAAGAAGVPRIVHISVTNASPSSPLAYFRGKGLTEESVVRSGLSHAIIRPSLVFGREDILVNNIAWILRRMPIFGVPGSGDYRVQPVSVEDVADLAVSSGSRTDSIVMDAVGPEVFSFKELIRMISAAVGSRARLVSIRPTVALLAVALIGRLVDDIVLTSDELEGLMANLLVSGGPPTGTRRFSEWLTEYAGRVGLTYAHELKRHYRSATRSTGP
ncbi:MAG: epimerase, partial [Gammaproteobacteria bacterium]